ncbi:MAG: TrmH family RNA methyltransferase [Anaerolineae bacterium]
MIRIESLGNDRVRRVLALQRSTRRRFRENLMVVEGQRLVDELSVSPVVAEEVFVTAEFLESGDDAHDLVEALEAQSTVIETSDEVMKAMSDTVTPQGILAVCPIPDLAANAGAAGRFVLIPDQVRDPGNLGTMLRTAWAAGATEVLLPSGNVDHTNPKVVRAGMGAHFRLPIHSADWEGIWTAIAQARVWIAEANRGTPYDAADWSGDVALVIGGEASGAGEWARSAADQARRVGYVHIPMARGVDSLNAAIATGILLFEAARHRRF